MENESRKKFVNNGIIIGCIVCCVGLLIPSVNIALGGAITMCLAQIVDIVWYLIERKFKDCKNIRQAFCKCRDIEILNEWDNIDTKLAKCVKCGKYFMINEKMGGIIPISKEEYEKQVNFFNIMHKSIEDVSNMISNMDLDFGKILEEIEDNDKEKGE